MSLAGLCSRDSGTAKRLVTTRGTAGGQSRTYTTAGRGSLPTDITCRLQEIDADEKREFGVRGERRAWKVQCVTDPTLTVEDSLEFTDADGVDRTTRVIRPSRNLDGQGRLWTTVVEEITN